ncbi:hypothetical protein [Kutzneria albida]|uniref:KOW domain-containing protein n=1 Tax=Kutzneria albida DSM 43870 TaxID=1449976 RepID=W5W124_9PSEU|nr:hypothetical protein [Kutzneria albida]AHH94883.1 hypothetical protein KALB_1510 [Kutzneria albida DSM 43870]
MSDPRYNPQEDDRVHVIGGQFKGMDGTVMDTMIDVPGIHEPFAIVELDGFPSVHCIEFIHLSPVQPDPSLSLE